MSCPWCKEKAHIYIKMSKTALVPPTVCEFVTSSVNIVGVNKHKESHMPGCLNTAYKTAVCLGVCV